MIEINYLSCFYHISITGWGERMGRACHPVIENVIEINYLSCFYHVSVTGTSITGGYLQLMWGFWTFDCATEIIVIFRGSP